MVNQTQKDSQLYINNKPKDNFQKTACPNNFIYTNPSNIYISISLKDKPNTSNYITEVGMDHD